jgi:GrpB-like predicted nucleotidyltransferase (UPF0157 family)
MIGLRRDTIQVVQHDQRWAALFEHERQILHEHLGILVLDIQHIGSTAASTVDAKPIIDIALAVASDAEIPGCRQVLTELGYIDRGDLGSEGGYLFVKESASEVRTHHLHIVTVDDPQWDAYLRFRDRLRADGRIASQYSALKRALQEQFPHDRHSYTRAKQSFVQSVLSGRPPR